MVGQIFARFQMTVEHSAIALQSDLVSDLGGLQPFVAVNFVIANDAPDAF